MDTAHAYGLIATAEGVERHTQLAALHDIGCDHAQGFLIHLPAPATTFTASA